MQVKELSDILCRLVYYNSDKPVAECYNYMLSTLGDDDAKTAVRHYQMLIEAGDAVRESDPDITDALMKENEEEEYER